MKFIIISMSAAVISYLLAAALVMILFKVSKKGTGLAKKERILVTLAVWIAL